MEYRRKDREQEDRIEGHTKPGQQKIYFIQKSVIITRMLLGRFVFL